MSQDIPEDIVNLEDLPPPSEHLDEFITGDDQCMDSCGCQDTQSCYCPDVIPPDAEI